MLAPLVLSFAPQTPQTSENTFFYSKIGAELDVVAYHNNYGSFHDNPSGTIPGNGQG